MAYNYRQEYLLAHKELVTQLIDLADRRAIATAVFNTPNEAGSFQYLVNNLLRSLAIWQPGRAYVRNTLGTTIREDHGKWMIDVGPYTERSRGRRATMVERAPQDSGELVIAEAITAENWTAIGIKLAVAKADKNTRRIIFNVPPESRGIEFIAEQLKPEFDLVTTKPRMILERPMTSKPSEPNT